MTEDKRKLKMWIWVTIVSVVIGVVWISSIKYSIKNSLVGLASKKDAGLEQAAELRESLKKEIDQMRNLLTAAVTTSTPQSTTSTIQNTTSTNKN